MTNATREQQTERILDLTLEVNFLLTGEDYMFVKRPGGSVLQSSGPRAPEGESAEPPPHSVTHENNEDLKVLDLSNKVIHLLTGMVWEYLKGHAESFKDRMMETDRHLVSPYGRVSGRGAGEPNPPVASPNRVVDDGGSMSSLKNEPEDQDLDIASPEGRNLSGADVFPTPGRTQAADASICIKEELASWEKGILAVTSPPAGDGQMDDVSNPNPASPERRNLTSTAIYPPAEHTQTECPTTTRIKGEIVPREGENLTDPDKCTSTGDVRVHRMPGLNIATQKDGGLVFPRPDHIEIIEYTSLFIKEESASRDGEDFMDAVLYPPREHTQMMEYPSAPMDASSEDRFAKPDLSSPFYHVGVQSERGGSFYDSRLSSADSYLVSSERAHEGSNAICSDGGRMFAGETSLIGHECFKLKTRVRRTRTASHLPKQFSCSECGRRFNHTSSLRTHLRTHTGVRPYSCDECGKSFIQKSDLGKHLRTHTGERPFPCAECGKRFTQVSNLNKHLRVHTGKKPYPCSECSRYFSDQLTLRNHQAVHTGERPFACPECGKCYTQQSSLRAHRLTHKSGKSRSRCESKTLLGENQG